MDRLSLCISRGCNIGNKKIAMQNIINKVKTALKNSKGTVVSEVQQRDAFSQDFLLTFL